MFRILSIDGGGIRGAFAAGFFAKIEAEIGKPIGEHFDLIAGTSTGAIIAASIAFGIPAEEVARLYSERGAAIFKRAPLGQRPWWASLAERILRKRGGPDVASLLRTKYESDCLAGELSDVFGDRTLRKSERRLVIPAVDLTQGHTVVFKTPHLPGMVRDPQLRVVDVLRATTAAPTYFPHATIDGGSRYCDGGLWANNPVMVGYCEALKIRAALIEADGAAPFDVSDIHALSVGAGERARFHAPPGSDAGLFWWGPRIIDAVGSAHSQGTRHQAEYAMGDQHLRVDFQIPGDDWALDATDRVKDLLHFGRERAAHLIGQLRSGFFSKPAANPRWFLADVDDERR